MHLIQIHKVIDQMISSFRRFGIWHGQDAATVSQQRLKSLYFIYYLFFFASFLIGAATKESLDESIFLAEMAIVITVLTTKIWMLLWKQKEIMGLLNRTCVFLIRYDEELAFFNDKVEKLIKFVVAFGYVTAVAMSGNSIFPFIGKQKRLIVDIAFPLDWKNSEIGFWLAYFFFLTENILSFPAIVIVTAIIWYLLLHCSLRYKILGTDIRNMGRIVGKLKMTEKERQTIFHRDLLEAIKGHLYLREIIDEVESFLSKLFLLQFAISAVCICSAIYCLAFDISVNFVQRLVQIYAFLYVIAELFMITYFGNDIKLYSSRLTYSLFECNWVEQPLATKKCILVFGEYLKRSHEVLIGKLYPLTLDTFVRILNSSYTLFNVLQNLKQ
ncbi:odorant receptor 94b-like isoform X3 [Bradysia coprophila]|uniref:odorant receptor 94b-like isoform X3 n=1 Tax=Bradysia coprophila TaxID=38358 RepID=UPI00187D99AA|nr:odorant receptor 94b-like isoform X3 [Bradysia coprophila]